MEAEDRAWNETTTFYNTYATNMQSSTSNLDASTSGTRDFPKSPRSHSPSAKSRGKLRAEDLRDWELEGKSKTEAEFTKDYLTRRKRIKDLSKIKEKGRVDARDIKGRMAGVQVKVNSIPRFFWSNR